MASIPMLSLSWVKVRVRVSEGGYRAWLVLSWVKVRVRVSGGGYRACLVLSWVKVRVRVTDRVRGRAR